MMFVKQFDWPSDLLYLCCCFVGTGHMLLDRLFPGDVSTACSKEKLIVVQNISKPKQLKCGQMKSLFGRSWKQCCIEFRYG